MTWLVDCVDWVDWVDWVDCVDWVDDESSDELDGVAEPMLSVPSSSLLTTIVDLVVDPDDSL